MASDRGGRPPGWAKALGIALRRSIPEFLHDHGPIFAAALSYYVVISLIPLILLLLAISGLVLEEGTVQSFVIRWVTQYVPGSEVLVATTINTVILGRGPIGAAAGIGLLWSALGLLTVIHQAVNAAWGVRKGSSVWKVGLVSFMMFGVLCATVFAAITFTTAARVIGSTPIVHEALRLIPGGKVIWNAAGSGSSITLTVIGLALLYRFLPAADVHWSDVWPGAVFVSALWEGAKWGFLWYISYVDFANVYGQIATVVILLVWSYLAGALLIWGAKVCAEFSRARAAEG